MIIANGEKWQQLKGKEYIALLESGILETYDYKCDSETVEYIDELSYILNSADITDWMCNLDKTMLKTGFNSFITLESEDYARRHYLCKKLKNIPKSVHNIFNLYLDLFYEKEKSRQGFNMYAYDDEEGCSLLEVDITESSDNKDALTIFAHILDGAQSFEEVDCVSYSKEDFYSKNIPSEYTSFTDTVNSVLREFKGVTIDRLSLFMASNLAVDFKNDYNKEAFSYFIGISRMYNSHWWIPENPKPITKDTYEICIMVVPTHSPCVVKRKDYYKRVLEYINSKDCDIDWEEIEDVNDNVIGYKNSFCKLMKNDTVESLMSRDINSIKNI